MRSTRAAAVFLFATAAALAQSPAGEWTGAIELPGSALAVTVTLQQTAGTWSGDIDIPAQGAVDLPLEAITMCARSSIDSGYRINSSAK